MAYCPECGAEIIPEDVFCGNCGITLTPIVPPVEELAFTESNAAGGDKDIPVPATAKEDLPNPASDLQIAENNSQKQIEDLPLTPFALENQAMTANDSSGNLTEKTADSIKNTVDNLPLKTEPAVVPAKTFEEENQFTEAAGKNDSNDELLAEKKVSYESVPVLAESAALTENKKNEASLPPVGERKIAASEPESDVPDFFVQEKSEDALNDKKLPPAAHENLADKPANKNLNEDLPKDISGAAPDPDFQNTIPYTPNTPKDFAAQQAMSSQIAAQTPPEKAGAADSKTSEPIKPPSAPVGSSMNDSLEPTLISVQIYEPKEKSADSDSESNAIIKTTAEIKRSAEQKKAQDAQGFTIPNISVGDTAGKGKAKLKPLDEGTVLNNRYEIVRKIGGGGMGAVYLASDRNLGGISRAVKEMVQSYIEDSQQEKAVNDFRRESMLLTSLEHPSIPTIYDYFFDEKEARFYLVMKYIPGGDLASRLRSSAEGKIDEASVTEWAIQLADVLDYLHNRQPPIIYRDLKPSNIMIDGNTGRVMLIDFGIARWVNKEEKGVTAVGTMGYAPPELFSGNVEPRSDIYSLGSTLFHLLTGADPQSNPLLIFDFQKNPRPCQINPQLTDQMEEILMKMVEYNADKRYASAAELRDALVIHLDNLKSGKVTVGISDSAKLNAPAVNQLVFCGFCGQKILAADVFCPFCGAQQTAGAKQTTVSAQAIYTPPATTARLMIIGTNELDSPVFDLEKDSNLVGRRDPMSNIFPEVDLSKFDPQTKISRRHARIWREQNAFMVEDLGSSNGTVLITKANESQKLGRNQPRMLTNGDKIRVGDTTLFFVTG